MPLAASLTISIPSQPILTSLPGRILAERSVQAEEIDHGLAVGRVLEPGKGHARAGHEGLRIGQVGVEYLRRPDHPRMFVRVGIGEVRDAAGGTADDTGQSRPDSGLVRLGPGGPAGEQADGYECDPENRHDPILLRSAVLRCSALSLHCGDIKYYRTIPKFPGPLGVTFR